MFGVLISWVCSLVPMDVGISVVVDYVFQWEEVQALSINDAREVIKF